MSARTEADFPDPADRTIRVCRFRLDQSPEDLGPFEALLSPPEQQRADRFRHPDKRREFVVCRARLRQQLGAVLGVAPQEVAFSYGLNGKPDLAHGDWRFNLSHTPGMAVIALAQRRKVGIDVEMIRPRPGLDRLAERYFAPEEVMRLQELPGERHLRAFFAVWTRKEAILKALGGGITLGLDRYVVTVDPDQPAKLVKCPASSEIWSLLDLNVGPGHAAALAVEGPAPVVTIRDL